MDLMKTYGRALIILVLGTAGLIGNLIALPGRGTPLHKVAAKKENTYQEALKRYTQLKEDIQLSPEQENERLAVLLKTIVHKDVGNVKKLIEKGMDPAMLVNLQDASSGLGSLRIHDGRIFIKGHSYKKPIPLIYYAAIKGSPDILGYLLQKVTGALQWNPEDNNLVNLVELVIKNSQEPGVLYKFLKDIPAEEREHYLKSLIRLYPKNIALISALLDRFKNSYDPNVLLAGAYPHSDTIRLLIDKYGADINAKTGGNGNPLLYRAARDKKLDLAKTLLALDADPNICNNLGEKPIDLTLPDSKLEQLLRSAGASRNYKCEYVCYNYGRQEQHDEQQASHETTFQKLIRYATGQTDYKCS